MPLSGHLLCVQCLSDSVRPTAGLIKCKLPTHDTAKLRSECALQRCDNVGDHLVERKVAFIVTYLGNESSNHQLLCPSNGGNILIPLDLEVSRRIPPGIVVELVVDPGDLITHLLPYLGV